MQLSAGVRSQLIRVAALAVIALGFAVRLYALARESLWYDEILQLEIAQGPLASIFPQLARHSAVPLDYVIAHFWIGLGRDEAWVRMPAVVAGVLALPVAFRLGRSLIGPGAGLLLAALLALAPMHVGYSQEARPYALVLLGATLAAFGFWRLRQTGRWRYALPLQAGVFIFALAHFFALSLLAVFVVFLVVEWLAGKRRAQAARTLLAVLAVCVLPALVYVAVGWGHPFLRVAGGFARAVVLEPARFTADPAQKPNLGAGPEVSWPFIRHWIVAPLSAGPGHSLWLFAGLAGLGLVHLLAGRRFWLSLFLLLWLALPPALILAFLIFRGTFFAPRYVIQILPAYLILAAAGVIAIPHHLRSRGLGWPAAGLLLGLSGLLFVAMGLELGRYHQRQNKEDWRLVARFVVANAGPDDAIIPVNTEPVINWYYPPAAAPVDHFDDLATIQAAVRQAERSWVIVSRYSSYIDDGPIKAWLGEQGAVRLDLDPDIGVYYLGWQVPRSELLLEIRGFALPVNHALYASLARENRAEPQVARRYYEMALANAPNEAVRAEYEQALQALQAR